MKTLTFFLMLLFSAPSVGLTLDTGTAFRSVNDVSTAYAICGYLESLARDRKWGQQTGLGFFELAQQLKNSCRVKIKNHVMNIDKVQLGAQDPVIQKYSGLVYAGRVELEVTPLADGQSFECVAETYVSVYGKAVNTFEERCRF